MNRNDKFMRCPHCLALQEQPASHQPELEAEILQAVSASERNAGRATTRAVAMRLMLSETQTYRYLSRLEQTGRIKRIGTRGGWRLAA